MFSLKSHENNCAFCKVFKNACFVEYLRRVGPVLSGRVCRNGAVVSITWDYESQTRDHARHAEKLIL